MAEVEYKGLKFSGGKLLVILPLLGTLGGGLWAGFEFYKDYMNMRSKIESYSAPDLSGFDKKLGVLKQKMTGVEDSVTKATDYTRDIKNDLKKDISRLERTVDSTERRVKKSEQDVRSSIEKNETKVRGSITTAEDRFDKRREQMRNDMTALETRVNDLIKTLKAETNTKIRKALENPLAKIK